jgi:uncharacterized membrane protein YdjX (TVP38/TMEM64 family)
MIDAPFGRAILAVALARLPPQMPFALTNFLAASSGVRLVPLMLGTAIGMAPRIGLVVWLGAELTGWKLGEPIPASLVWAFAGAVIGFGGLGIWSWRLLRWPATTPDDQSGAHRRESGPGGTGPPTGGTASTPSSPNQ